MVNTLHVSQHLLVQILLRLPAKSLLRFKSVCKYWLSLIESPDFVKQHHRWRQDDLILIRGCVHDVIFTLLSDHHHPLILLPWFRNFSLIHLHGVLCMYCHDQNNSCDADTNLLMHAVHIYLWNPATEHIRLLPPANYPLPLVADDEPLDASIGFGFDVRTNDYKVVRLMVQDTSTGVKGLVEVYDLYTNSWTILDRELPVESIISSMNEPFGNGRIHCWRGRKDRYDRFSHLLLWFDFTTDELGTISFPNSIRDHSSVELTAICDNIASVSDAGHGDFEVWMMSEFAMHDSWIHLYSVQLCWDLTLSLFDDGESFLGIWNSRLCIYHRASQQLKYLLPIENDMSDGLVLKYVRYKESLVSIEGGAPSNRKRNWSVIEFPSHHLTSMADTPHIPEHLLWQILLRLPVESLLRFKCVCKSWLSMIESPDFVKQHHRQRRDDRILMHGCGSFTLLSNLHNVRLGFLPDDPSHAWFGNFSMIHLDGILCLHFRDPKDTYSADGEVEIHAMQTYLWNPATRKIRCLPPACYPLPPMSDSSYVSIGFGLDFKTNDYKVVKLLVWNTWLGVKNKVELYNLSSNSWSILPLECYVEVIISSIKEPLNNGRLHCWCARKYRYEPFSHFLLWFDFSTNEFGTITFPGSVTYGVHMELTIIKGNIASVSDIGKGEFEVWMMNEFGIQESWINLYRVQLCWERTMSLFDNGETFLGVWNFRLCTYDSASRKLKYLLPLEMDLFGGIIMKDVRYKESLVSIGGESEASNRRPTIRASPKSLI